MSRATDSRHRLTAGNRYRLLVRLLGQTGLFAAAVGLVARGSPFPELSGVGELRTWLGEFAALVPHDPGLIALVAGLAAVLLWVGSEAFAGLFLGTGRRSAVGVNAAVQVGLAAALLVVANLASDASFRRYDLTRDRQFTLPADLVAELKNLRGDGPTTVVVLKLTAAGVLGGKPDAYDSAAEAKTVEKVRDVVDQLREFGPQFRVVTLDRNATEFEQSLKALTDRRPGLAAAIESALESSLFFYADAKVQALPREEAERLALTGVGQRPSLAPDPANADKTLVYPANVARMGFSEFYQLDKTRSKSASESERESVGGLAGGLAFAPAARGQGNLVLLPRGPGTLVRKILSLEERKPRVGLAVIHPLLTSRETVEDYTSSGMRASLERNGFEVTDIILKRWGRGGPPSPAATTYEESDFDRVEARANLLAVFVADRELAIKLLSGSREQAEKALARAAEAKTPEERQKAVADAARALQGFVRGRLQAEADVRLVLTRLTEQIEVFRAELADFTDKSREADAQYRDRVRNERALENRRLTDVKAKLAAYVADCDALVVPRLTVVDITRGDAGTIPASLFGLSADQAEVVREFIKAGKPVLFALGPTLADPRSPGDGADDIEKLLPQFGILPGRQTVLTDDDVQAMAERQGNAELGVAVKLGALNFEYPEPPGKRPNPVAEALRLTGRTAGQAIEVRQTAFRTVTVTPALAGRLPYAAEFLFTGANSFNKEKPLPEGEYVPKFEPAKADDPRRGTPDEERRGPFPVAVAAEVPIPADWLDTPKVGKGQEALAALAGAPPAVGPAMSLRDRRALAALAFRFDGGVSAAALTAAVESAPRPTVRLAVFGHGGLFVGSQLKPGPEALLVQTLNWQLRRDARLPQDVSEAETWHYPRAHLTPREQSLWTYAAGYGLPLLVAYLGFMTLLIRKVR